MNSDHSKPANADDQYLKYGDVILLEFDEGTSFLFSEGFQETQEVKTRVNDDIVNAEESSINNGGNLNYHLMFGGYGENFQSGLFEIVPTLQYENLKAFLKTYEDCVHVSQQDCFISPSAKIYSFLCLKYHFWEENHHHQFVIKPQVKRTLTTSQHEHFVDLLESTYIEFSTNEKEIQRKKGKVSGNQKKPFCPQVLLTRRLYLADSVRQNT